MILCLTYHKLFESSAGGDDDDFYSVVKENFARQIQATLDAGFTPLNLTQIKPQPSSAGRRFILTFDDGTADHCDIALPILNRFNLHGIFFVPTAKLNRPGYLTDTQVRELADTGQIIGCHSHEHRRLDTLNETQVRHQLRTSCQKLEQITGKPVWAFAPPGGFINPAVQRIALETGLNVIRTMRWGFNCKLDFTSLETVPINRHTTGRQFQKILEGKQPRLLYFGKQAAKALVPARTYERLRGWIFKLKRKT